MRRPLLAVASSLALVAAAAPFAHGATRVDGDHFVASGLRVATQGCSDPVAQPSDAPRLRLRKGPGSVPIGKRSVGWTLAGSSFGVGPQVKVASPSTTTIFRIRLNSPADAADGRAVVSYFAPNDTGVWRGTGVLPTDTESGWHTVDASSVIYDWRHYTNGEFDGSAPSARLSSFVSSRGGDGNGADLGIIHGCDGNAFWVDKFEVGSDDASRTYNFEGFRTKPRLMVDGKTPSKRVVTFGRSLDLGGRLFRKVSDDRIGGVLALQARKLSGGSFQPIGRDRTTTTNNASFRVTPKRSSLLRLAYAGSPANEAGTSHVLRLLVRMAVGAGLVDNTITRGQSMVVSGKVRPGRSTRILLQRYVNRDWKTIRSGRSGKDGGYRIGTAVSSVGTSYWRIKANGGDGTVDGVSRNLKLTVKYPPGPGPDPDPDPDPEEPPPPPPEG